MKKKSIRHNRRRCIGQNLLKEKEKRRQKSKKKELLFSLKEKRSLLKQEFFSCRYQLVWSFTNKLYCCINWALQKLETIFSTGLYPCQLCFAKLNGGVNSDYGLHPLRSVSHVLIYINNCFNWSNFN